MTKKTADRVEHFKKIYKDLDKVQKFKDRNTGKVSFQPIDKEGKKIGRVILQGTQTYNLLSKYYQGYFPTPKGQTLHSNNKKLVPESRANITRHFKSADWKKYGFPSRKVGEEFIRELKKNKYYIKDEEDLNKISKINEIAKNIKTGEEYATNYIKANKITRIIKNLGRVKVSQVRTSYKSYQEIYKFETIEHRFFNTSSVARDIMNYMGNIQPAMMLKIYKFMKNSPNIKLFVQMHTIFFKWHFNEETGLKEKAYVRDIPPCASKTMKIINPNQIEPTLKKITDYITEQVETMIRNDSGLIFERVQETFLNMGSITFASATSWFEMDDYISKKKAVINPKNNDNRCFDYAVISALHYDSLGGNKHYSRATTKQFEHFFNKYGWDGSDCPITTDFKDVWRKKEDDVRCKIHCLSYNHGSGQVPSQWYESDAPYENSITLMLVHKNETEDEPFKNHYVWVKSRSRLISSEESKRQNARHYCTHCIGKGFATKEGLERHVKMCSQGEQCIIEMPTEDKTDLKFINFSKMLNLPFVHYADFEAIIKKHNEQIGSNTLKDGTATTIKTTVHEPCGVKYITVNRLYETPQLQNEFIYRGENCTRNFIEKIIEDCSELYKKYFMQKKEMNLTEKEEMSFKKAKTCHICNDTVKPEGAKDDNGKRHPKAKVRDHCHFTGKYRGCAHSDCNIRYQKKPVFPVFFHNLKGYDSHFIIKNINDGDCEKITCIPFNRHQFISFSLHLNRNIDGSKIKEDDDKDSKYYDGNKLKFEIRFLNTQAFLNASLDKLVKTLDVKDLKFTMNWLRKRTPWLKNPVQRMTHFFKIKEKGVYPYEYMDSFDRFNETQLPPKEEFLSRLSKQVDEFDQLTYKDKEEIDTDVNRANTVFKLFKCRNLGDYHDLYLETDVYLLADVFENFRSEMLNMYKLDPAHYYTLPGFGWDALLKYTNVELKLFGEGEQDKYEFIEGGLIGGISGVCASRYAKANNKHMEDYDENADKSYIMYFDANNLYGGAMCEKLPFSGFQWVDMDVNGLLNVMENLEGEYGYFAEVDAYIPDNLHDYMNDYPVLPSKMKVTDDMLSPAQLELKEAISMEKLRVYGTQCKSVETEKLCPNLLPKEKYICHFKTLKLYVDLGAKITKVHRVMRFNQKAWMKPYVDVCSKKRKQAKSDFHKDLYKLLVNSVFGKSMEDVRRRVTVEIFTGEKRLQQLTNRVGENGTLAFPINDDGLMMMDIPKRTIKLNKPIYAGMSILHLSKHTMYDWWYNIMKKSYNEKVRLLYTDTDSFIFQVHTDDFFRDINENKELLESMDLSNYSEDHDIFKGWKRQDILAFQYKNKKVVNKMKDDCGGKIITEHFGIRSKMYYDVVQGDKDKKTAKGIKKAIVGRKDRDDYFNTVFHNWEGKNLLQLETMNLLRSDRSHELYNVKITKSGLSPFDNKKYILPDRINQLSFGHWRIPKN